MFDTKKASLAKEEIQEQAVALAWMEDNLLLSWATGCGKTLAVLKIIEEYWKTKCYIPTVYIVLKEIAHHANWQEEFKKHGMENLLQHVRFFCYASLSKFADTNCNILILDECHALSEMREDYLKTITCDKIISLSATVDAGVKQRIKNYKEGFFEYHISLQSAIDRGLLPEPHIYVAYVDLDNRQRMHYWAQKGKKSTKQVGTLVTAKQYYTLLQKRIDMYDALNKEGKTWAKNKWIQYMGMRKKFMAKAKTDATQLLLQMLANKKYICFCGSIEQASELGADWAIHSKIDKDTRQELIEDFNNGTNIHIYAVNMLRESMNLKDIEAAIIVQLDNQQGSTEQMIGRSLRSIAPEVYILILRDTKDEDYLDKATRGISSQYISEYTWLKDED